MTFQQLILLGLQISILLSVFRFGLQASPGDVTGLLRQPWRLSRSLAAMFVITPLWAIVLVKTFALRVPIEIIVVALSISPLPPLLPAKQIKAGAHVSYGLGLMVIAGVLAIVIVPLGLEVLQRVFDRPLEMPLGAVITLVLKTTLLPLAAGMAVHMFAPAAALRLARPVGLIGNSLLAIGALALAVGALPAAWSLVGNGTLIALAVFVFVALVIGHLLGGPRLDDRAVLALSTAGRHPLIALTIAKANFPEEPQLAAAVVLYLLVNTVVGMFYLARLRRTLPVQRQG